MPKSFNIDNDICWFCCGQIFYNNIYLVILIVQNIHTPKFAGNVYSSFSFVVEDGSFVSIK